MKTKDRYSEIIDEAQELFESILKDSSMVQDCPLYDDWQHDHSAKKKVNICLTNNT